ncbi:enoyl-CoA hydratase-related protein [Variovorax sp. LjRoot84]|uniref:enoyl-CoA hydratase/isomerase family protein n=1 Tax=Variovorax sp. LjRoot84 TaxID=3342340 RepID=UPI003ED15BA6
MSNQLVKTVKEGPVLVVRLDSPENRNSLTTELRRQLGEAVVQADGDPSIRAMYLTGEGPTFCSGGDFKMLQTQVDPWPVHRRFSNLKSWLIPLITLAKPVVVGVRGPAVGGGMGLALTGDVVIAAESAKFVAGFFRVGTIPDVGVMYCLPRLIGMARAKNFIFSNGTILPQEALELGLVAKVVPDDQLEAAGLAEAKRLAEGPSEVMGLAKNLMARSFETSLQDMFAFEGLGAVLAMSSPEFREGVAAIVGKREPDFAAAAGAAPHNAKFT